MYVAPNKNRPGLKARSKALAAQKVAEAEAVKVENRKKMREVAGK